MKKLQNVSWYILVAPFVLLLIGCIACAAVYALVWLVLDEMKQRHNRLVLYQQIDSFLAQQRQLNKR